MRDDEIDSDLSVTFTVVDAPRDHDAKTHSLKAVNACVASSVHMLKETSKEVFMKGRICDDLDGNTCWRGIMFFRCLFYFLTNKQRAESILNHHKNTFMVMKRKK